MNAGRDPTTHAPSLADRLRACPGFPRVLRPPPRSLRRCRRGAPPPRSSRSTAAAPPASSLALERLRTTASALHTAAHPDDEDTALIARLARGDHARVAYLSLNRGEGGQNIIGTELFDAPRRHPHRRAAAGARARRRRTVLHTRLRLRLHQDARGSGGEVGRRRHPRRHGARHPRATGRWSILNGWSGTPADGHGQHQLAGKLAPLAFAAAADPAKYPEQLAEGLRPWQARKLYVRQGFSPDAGAADAAAVDRHRRSRARPQPTSRSRWRDAASTSRRRWASSKRAAPRRRT